MKSLLLALLLLMAPVAANASLSSYEAELLLDKDPVCSASLKMVEGELNAVYVPARIAMAYGYPGPLIGLRVNDVAPEWGALILLHEIGHCVQDVQGLIGDAERWEIEYDADRLSIERAYTLGLNPEFLLDTFQYVIDKYKPDLDVETNHGSIRGRVLHLQHVIRKTVPPQA